MIFERPTAVMVTTDWNEALFKLYSLTKYGVKLFRSRYGSLTDAGSWLFSEVGEYITTIHLIIKGKPTRVNDENGEWLKTVENILVDRKFANMREFELFVSEFHNTVPPTETITLARGINNELSELDHSTFFVLMRDSGMVMYALRTYDELVNFRQKNNVDIMFNNRSIVTQADWNHAMFNL